MMKKLIQILSISIDMQVKGYSKPIIALVDNGNPVYLKFDIVIGNNGEIVAIILEKDYVFTA